MKFHMNYWLILILAAALPWGLTAQDSAPQQLPTAPSATKYSPPPAPPQAAPPAASGAEQTVAPTPAPANPSGGPPTSSQPGSSQPSNTASPSEYGVGSAPASVTPSGPQGEGVDDTLTVIRKRVDEVNVVFTVTDKRDHFVKDLTQNDFRVIDDSKPVLSIQSFSRQTNLPLRVGLLIDASNSVRDRFKFEQEAAIEFLNQIIRPKSDRAFVIGFDTTPEVTQDFTADAEALSKGVRLLRAGGGTAMYDAIYFACRDKLMQADKGVIATRRAIILLSDGEDNQSRVSREEAV